MFDLIGFWTTVTILTLVITAIVWPIGSFIVGHIVLSVTQDGVLSRRAEQWVINDVGGRFLVFRRIPIHYGLAIPAMLISMLFLAIYTLICIGTSLTGKDIPAIVDIVSSVAIHTSSFMGYVGIVLVIYFGVILSGRELWKIKVKVDEVIKKAGD